MRKPPVPTADLLARIDRLADLGAFGLELTGGEPLLHPDLVALLDHGRRTGRFRMRGLISNGFLLTEERIEAFNRAGLTDLQVSVDGVVPREETQKVLARLEDRLRLLARRARFRVVLSAVVSGGAPLEEVREVIGFARAQGFRPRFLLLHDAHGNFARSPEELSAFRAAQRMVGRHVKDWIDYRSRLLERGTAPFKCRAGSRYLYVNEHGEALWCAHTRERFAKPLADYTLADLRTQFHTPKRCAPRCTLGCARSCSSLDGLRPQRLPPR